MIKIEEMKLKVNVNSIKINIFKIMISKKLLIIHFNFPLK